MNKRKNTHGKQYAPFSQCTLPGYTVEMLPVKKKKNQHQKYGSFKNKTQTVPLEYVHK